MDFVLAGAGNVGTATALLLARAGNRAAGVWSRSPDSRAAGAACLDTGAFDRLEDLPDADVVLIGVGEAAIEEVAGALPPALRSGSVVVHFAGATGIAPLSPVEESGGVACALHPVQSCPSFDAALRRLPGSAWGITTAPGAEEWAAALVRDSLGGIPVTVREEDRPLWHAAAVTTSNAIAAVLASGEAILESIGVSDPIAVLGPLAAGSLTNAREAGGGAAALTGPVVRGEVDTISRHVDALGKTSPELLARYVDAVRAVLRVARVERGLGAATAAAIEERLSS